MSNRIDEIDLMRGIGILLVVLGHVFPADTSIHEFIYSFHMPLFFIINGMTLSINRDDKILKKSDVKLIKEYFLYSALYIAFDVIVRLLVMKMYRISDIVVDLQNTVLLFGISVLWFLPTMVGARVLARKILSNSKLIFQICMCVGLVCIGLYVPYHDQQTWITKIILVAQRISVSSSYVIIGYHLRKYFSRMKIRMILICAGLPNVLLTHAAKGIDFRTLSWGNNVILVIIFSLSGTMMVVGIANLLLHITKLKDGFIYLSGQSLRIMVFHSYLMLPGLIDVVLSRMKLNLSTALYFSLKTGVLIILVILICMTVDGIKNKWKEWIRHA